MREVQINDIVYFLHLNNIVKGKVIGIHKDFILEDDEIKKSIKYIIINEYAEYALNVENVSFYIETLCNRLKNTFITKK